MPYLGVKPADITSATEAEIAGDLTVDTNTLHVDAANNSVGIGTAAPDNLLTISGGDSGHSWSYDSGDLLIIEDNDSASINIATPAANSANILFSDADARGQGRIAYTHSSDKMEFMTGGISNTRMTIDSSGKIGVGTTGPTAFVEVRGSSTNDNIGTLYVQNKNTGNNAAIAAFSTASSDTSTSNVLLRFGSNDYAAGQGMITANGAGAATFGSFSDRTLKENIADLPSQLASIMALRPVEFDYIESEGGGHQIGFIAQEVETIYPDLVGENDDGIKMLAGLDKTSARLVKALQEAVAKIETLETEMTALKARVTALEDA